MEYSALPVVPVTRFKSHAAAHDSIKHSIEALKLLPRALLERFGPIHIMENELSLLLHHTSNRLDGLHWVSAGNEITRALPSAFAEYALGSHPRYNPV
jgi:hypothetical protein